MLFFPNSVANGVFSPEMLRCALVQAPGQIQRGSRKGSEGSGGRSGRLWCRAREALVQSQLSFNRAPEKVPEKVLEALVQSQVRFNRVPEKMPGAEPGQVHRVPKKVPEKVWEALVQQVRFNRVRVPEKVPEKVLEKVPGGFGAELGQGLGGVGAESGQV